MLSGSLDQIEQFLAASDGKLFKNEAFFFHWFDAQHFPLNSQQLCTLHDLHECPEQLQLKIS